MQTGGGETGRKARLLAEFDVSFACEDVAGTELIHRAMVPDTSLGLRQAGH